MFSVHTDWKVWSSNQVQLGKIVWDVEVLLVERQCFHGYLYVREIIFRLYSVHKLLL